MQDTELINGSSKPNKTGLLDGLASMPVKHKLRSIGIGMSIPLFALSALSIAYQTSGIRDNLNQINGLKYSSSFSHVQCGLYDGIQGILNSNSANTKKGIQEFDDAMPKLDATMSSSENNIKNQWASTKSALAYLKNKILSNDIDKFNMIETFENVNQENNQNIIEEIMYRYGLNNEKDPSLSSLMMANQRDLPQLIVNMQLVAAYTKLLEKDASNETIKAKIRRHIDLAYGNLSVYEADIGRAVSHNSKLSETIGVSIFDAVKLIKISINNSELALKSDEYGNSLQRSLQLAIDGVEKSYNETMQFTNNEIFGYINHKIAYMILGLLLLFAIVSASLWLLINMSRSISNQLSRLTSASKKIANGEHGVKVEVISDDELGMLASTFNKAAERMDENSIKMENERNSSETMQRNIGEFLDVAMDIADGDLSRKGKVTEDILGNVVDSINVMTQELSKVLGTVKSASSSVNQGSMIMLNTTAQIELGSKTTNEQVTRLTAHAQEVSSQIQQMAQLADDSANTARQALSAAEVGQQAVATTLGGMESILGSTQSVTKRVEALTFKSTQIQMALETINNIASHTNLLALHASLEAAGSGEAGGRFGVVAAEIRQLAEEVAQATEQVTELLGSVQEEIRQVSVSVKDSYSRAESGYKIANEAGIRLREIGEYANRSAQFANNISIAAKEQVHGVEKITKSANEISQITQSAQESVSKSRSAAERLQDLTKQLDNSISRFRLSNN